MAFSDVMSQCLKIHHKSLIVQHCERSDLVRTKKTFYTTFQLSLLLSKSNLLPKMVRKLGPSGLGHSDLSLLHFLNFRAEIKDFLERVTIDNLKIVADDFKS